MPFAINEIGLVELPVVLYLQKVYGHLSRIENRSFVVLGSFPVSFGSLASVSRIQSYLSHISHGQLSSIVVNELQF